MSHSPFDNTEVFHTEHTQGFTPPSQTFSPPPKQRFNDDTDYIPQQKRKRDSLLIKHKLMIALGIIAALIAFLAGAALLTAGFLAASGTISLAIIGVAAAMMPAVIAAALGVGAVVFVAPVLVASLAGAFKYLDNFNSRKKTDLYEDSSNNSNAKLVMACKIACALLALTAVVGMAIFTIGIAALAFPATAAAFIGAIAALVGVSVSTAAMGVTVTGAATAVVSTVVAGGFTLFPSYVEAKKNQHDSESTLTV